MHLMRSVLLHLLYNGSGSLLAGAMVGEWEEVRHDVTTHRSRTIDVGELSMRTRFAVLVLIQPCGGTAAAGVVRGMHGAI